MLDKIEVGKTYYSGLPSCTRTVLFVGEEQVVFTDQNGNECTEELGLALKLWEPLPSPESPVVQDDVIWEEKDYRLSASRGLEYTNGDGEWRASCASPFVSLAKFAADLYNRLNPTPAALEEWPKIGETYYLANPMASDWFDPITWGNDSVDREWKKRGLIHRTKEEAVAAGQAMAEAAKNMAEGVQK